MKIQYTCCCGSKFIAIVETVGRKPEDFSTELNFAIEEYERFRIRHASCHKNKGILK